MALTKFTASTLIKSSEVNTNFNESLRATGQTLINQAENRVITLPGDGGIFVEAYVSLTGRQSSVNIGTSMPPAVYDSVEDSYSGASPVDMTAFSNYDPDGVTNPSNCFDTSTTTSASKQTDNTSGFVDTILGKTFTSRLVQNIYVKASGTVTAPSASNGSIFVQTYNGSIWTTHSTIITAPSNSGGIQYDGFVNINSTVQGIAIGIGTVGENSGSDHTHTFNSLILYEDGASEISHTIPASTFSSTISNAFLTFKADNWETGADIQYKLTNAVPEDTGWLDANEIQTFTAFTSQPTTLIVKLIPKSVSPTAGFPSVRGIQLIGDRPL